MLNLNVTLFIQLIVFLTFMWVLSRFLFKPILSIINERFEKTDGLKTQVLEMEEEIRKKTEKYESMVKEANVKAKDIKNAIKTDGLEEEKSIIRSVRNETKDVIEEKKEGIYKEVEQVKMDMKGEVEAISQSIAEKVLGRRV